MAALTSSYLNYISVFIVVISQSLSFSPTPSSFSSPFSQIYCEWICPWKIHCEVWTQCFSVWSVNCLLQKCPGFYKQILGPTSKPLNQNLCWWAHAFESLTSILNNSYANPIFKSTALKALRKQFIFVINGWSLIHNTYATKISFTFLLFKYLLIVFFNMFCFCWKVLSNQEEA